MYCCLYLVLPMIFTDCSEYSNLDWYKNVASDNFRDPDFSFSSPFRLSLFPWFRMLVFCFFFNQCLAAFTLTLCSYNSRSFRKLNPFPRYIKPFENCMLHCFLLSVTLFFFFAQLLCRGLCRMRATNHPCYFVPIILLRHWSHSSIETGFTYFSLCIVTNGGCYMNKASK